MLSVYVYAYIDFDVRVCVHISCLPGAWGRACRSGRAPGPQTRAPSGERSSWRYDVLCRSGQHFLVLKPVGRTMCNRRLTRWQNDLHKLRICAHKAYPYAHKAYTYTYKTTDTHERAHTQRDGNAKFQTPIIACENCNDYRCVYTDTHTHT